MRLLSDPEVSTWSDHRIGDLCALNHKTIARLRKLSGANPQMQARLVERGGVIYEMRLPVRKNKRDAGERIKRGADKRAIDPTTEPTVPASRAEEINETWQVSEGDVYVIESQTSERQHIIICGDSALAETYQPVRSLTSRVGLLVSDVPYNCDIVDGPRTNKRETNSHLAIANDNLNDVDYELILFNALRQAKTFLRPGGSYYCFMSTKHLVMTTDVLTKAIAAPVTDEPVLGANQFEVEFRSYFREANFEKARRLLRIASPSFVSVYSTRGGISANIRRVINPACSSSTSLTVRVDELISFISFLKSPKRITPRSPSRKSNLSAYLRPMICTSPVVWQWHRWLPADAAARSMHPQVFSSGTVKIGSPINLPRASQPLAHRATHNLRSHSVNQMRRERVNMSRERVFCRQFRQTERRHYSLVGGEPDKCAEGKSGSCRHARHEFGHSAV